MNYKKKIIYLKILIIILIIFVFELIIIDLNPNSNIIKIENRIYYNKSFGLNYLDICQKKYLMRFNRENPNFKSNILVTLILIYPNPFIIIKANIVDYIDIISKEIDFNFSLAIITCNNNISNIMINESSKINLKYISRFTLNNIGIPKSEYYSFVTHSRNKTIDVFYTNTHFSKFKNYVNKDYYTSVNKRKFTGYYSAGTNYYAYVPSHIGLFDYFDFFIKFDHDQIKKLKFNSTFEPFPLKYMIKNNNYFFFGCLLKNDNSVVTTNLYKTFFLYILKQNEKCKFSILPNKLYKYKETISSPGAFNIIWLGFYSMLNIRYFSEEYISTPDGLYQNRWGDQQFFIPTLFGYDFRNFSYFNKNTYLCSWMK
jgi:hypothetical protein